MLIPVSVMKADIWSTVISNFPIAIRFGMTTRRGNPSTSRWPGSVMGEPITVWRTALHQKRPYLDLTDGVRALKFILQGKRFDNRVYNVVTDNSTVSDIVDVITPAFVE